MLITGGLVAVSAGVPAVEQVDRFRFFQVDQKNARFWNGQLPRSCNQAGPAYSRVLRDLPNGLLDAALHKFCGGAAVFCNVVEFSQVFTPAAWRPSMRLAFFRHGAQ